jgi:hypothetical protein
MPRIRLRRCTLFFILLAMCIFTARAQDEKFKAIFVYNFTKYIDWPAKPGNFIITVFGNDPITAEIQSIASKKTVGSTSIDVKNIRSAAEISSCHILYVPDSKSDALTQVLAKAKDMNILVITENKDACKNGSCINFVSNGGKITYEISRKNIENNGLKVSGDLMQLGIIVN